MDRRLSSMVFRRFHVCAALRRGHPEPVLANVKHGKSMCAKSRDASEIIMDDSIDSRTMHSLLMSQASKSAIVQRKGSCSEILEKETRDILESFGELEYFSKSSSTHEKCRYLVEFRSKAALSNLLYRGRDGAVDSHMVEIAEKNKTDSETIVQQNVSKLQRKQKVDQRKLKALLLKQPTMDDQIKIVVERNMMSSHEIRLRYLFLHVLENLLKNHLSVPFFLRPYGSVTTGTGMPGSDLDVLIFTQDYVQNTEKALPKEHRLLDTEIAMRSGFQAKRIRILEETDKLIQRYLDVEDVQLILSARVPILKFRYSLLDLSVDIAVDQFHGDNFSSIINWYIRFDKRVLPVLFIVRKWAEARQLLSHGVDYDGFTPFMLQMIVLIYLMRASIIPPMKSVGKRHRDKLVITKTPKEFQPKSNNSDTVAELVFGFFYYFSTHGLRGKKLTAMDGLVRHRQYQNQNVWIKNPFDDAANIAAHLKSSKVDEMVGEMKKTTRLLFYRRERMEDRDWGLVSMLYKPS